MSEALLDESLLRLSAHVDDGRAVPLTRGQPTIAGNRAFITTPHGDAYNGACNSRTRANCPTNDGPDFDFGQPPILVQLSASASGAKRALVIGQKSGMVHALDPDAKGKILWQTRAGAGEFLGGSQWGSAACPGTSCWHSRWMGNNDPGARNSNWIHQG